MMRFIILLKERCLKIFVIKSFLSAQFRKIVMKIILNKNRAPSGVLL